MLLQTSSITNNNLHTFIAQQAEAQDAFTLLKELAAWLRQGGAKLAPQRVQTIISILQNDADLCSKMAHLLCDWLCTVRLYPLFISAGIFSREGFMKELAARGYERFNPAYKDMGDLRDAFAQIFADENDGQWLNAVAERKWLKLFSLIRRHTPQNDRDTAQRYMRSEGFYAIEMLSIWVAAEELEPDLIRLDKKLLDRDSPFVALKREVMLWVAARNENRDFDSSHLEVMLNQSRQQVETLRKKGTAEGAGSSLSVAHLLERLDQTLNRMTLLMRVFHPDVVAPRQVLFLASHLAQATANQHSLSWLWKRSVKMLSRSITQNTSSHGEHYITRNKKEYVQMLRSAAGGGVLIALMSLFKIHLGKNIDNHFWLGIAEGLNYGIGFAIIFMLGLTVATKQPAMTASRFAAAVERNEKGHVVNMKLAQLLVDVMRSQAAAVFGNVFVAFSLASIIALIYGWSHDFPLLNKAQVMYQVQSVNLWGATLWYAAIAGVWLFCSGIISGFFDNRCDYLNLRMRLRHHPVLKWLLPENIRSQFADYVHNNYGSIMGNLCFGMLLGMTGFVGHITGLPFDIRHVAFSSANVGYAGVSGALGWGMMIQLVCCVLAIGAVNLAVSFSITMWVALRSRESQVDSWWEIIKCVCRIAKERPLSLLLPLQLPPEPVSPSHKNDKTETAQ
ncbi:site-specific recombinase [Alysiella filiformis]|uniref:Site-specific recombinase n=2 Tax=Alysiella TaxID=194195 RepID=A0A286EGM5_9NEIS|nr:recombinase [Alysiella filiformis]QMT31806.1 recombinase [Alysiella filiformis]SOD70063.1 Site-specific recombinase [Alysiella filiformis DSM 16848]